MPEKEGLIKFNLSYSASPALPMEMVRPLCGWRRVFRDTGLIGQAPTRYMGLGFGNISCRLDRLSPETPEPALFAITGTQTGHLANLDARHIAIVVDCNVDQNHMIAAGPVRPSSESMTHAAIYLQDDAVGAVIHGHSPHIWHAARVLKLPVIDSTVKYGTPAMARAVQSEVQTIRRRRKPTLLTMESHEDGVLAFGSNLEIAGAVLLKYLAKAYALDQNITQCPQRLK